jgi:hypothetical protein
MVRVERVDVVACNKAVILKSDLLDLRVHEPGLCFADDNDEGPQILEKRLIAELQILQRIDEGKLVAA